MPFETWMASSTYRPLLEPLVRGLADWTAESLMPSWKAKKSSDSKRTDLFEWNRTLVDLLARAMPFVSLEGSRYILNPYMADDEEALHVIRLFQVATRCCHGVKSCATAASA